MDDPVETRKYQLIASALRNAHQAGRTWIGPFDFPCDVPTCDAEAWCAEVAQRRAEEEKRLSVAPVQESMRFLLYNLPTGKAAW